MTARNRHKARRRANRLRRQNAPAPLERRPERDEEPMWVKIALVWLGGLALGLMAWLAWLH